MYTNFNQNNFMTWMENEFNLDNYSIQTILSLVHYAYHYENTSLDQFAYFVSDILPEVEFLDVARFCEDNILTQNTLKQLNRI